MPELPEVETVRRTIGPQLIGRTLTGVDLIWSPVLQGAEHAGEVEAELSGAQLSGLERRGKFLGLRFDSGGMIGVHLRMTGRLIVEPVGASCGSHARARLHFSGRPERAESADPEAPPCELHFVDMRKFGRLYWLPEGGLEALPTVAAMGPEPLSEAFTPARLAGALAGRRAPIKSVLLDQRRIAGLGNIYADEALFAAGIAPTRPAGSLSVKEIDALHKSIRSVLETAVANGGSTIRDYVNGLGDIGHMQAYLSAYGKAGQPCPRCGEPLQRQVLSGRSSFFCPSCQR